MDKNKYIALKHEICDWDKDLFKSLVSVDITEEQKEIILNPEVIFPLQKNVLAIHWHPEIVPSDIVRRRIEKMYPNKRNELIIPTQHNDLLDFNGFSGVEIDCYSKVFHLKIQLLLHFSKQKLNDATKLKALLGHTFKYRSTQLFEFIDIIINKKNNTQLRKAVSETGSDDDTVQFTKTYITKLKRLIDTHYPEIPPVSIKNKLVRNYFNHLTHYFDVQTIHRAQILLNSIKKIMKKQFNPDYFYETHEIIEEVRAMGGGIIVPHPEQFWPVLLADYDVDGYEVWNPQSHEFTNFLIDVVRRKNQTSQYRNRPLLVTMGDDCHLGDKLVPSLQKNDKKRIREVGYQNAWRDYAVKKNLTRAGFEIEKIINEYRQRLLD